MRVDRYTPTKQTKKAPKTYLVVRTHEHRRVEVALHTDVGAKAAHGLIHGHRPVNGNNVSTRLRHALQEGARLVVGGGWWVVGGGISVVGGKRWVVGWYRMLDEVIDEITMITTN